jgi:hypothetical protein
LLKLNCIESSDKTDPQLYWSAPFSSVYFAIVENSQYFSHPDIAPGIQLKKYIKRI